MARNISLSKNWTFKEASDPNASYLPVSQFPTVVHLDLLFHDLIFDPYVAKNSSLIQWIGKTSWKYRTTFATPKEETTAHNYAYLVFEGLDTFATVWLNGKQILKSDNMFISKRVNVGSLLRQKQENELEINFDSAWDEGRKRMKRSPEHKWLCWNGDPSRLAIRKAPYHYGWDWGPKILTCGPWRPIHLECYDARVVEVDIKTKINDVLDVADVTIDLTIEGPATEAMLTLSCGDLKYLSSDRVVWGNKKGSISATWIVSKPQLWYPKGYGNQSLYQVEIELVNGKRHLNSTSRRFGLKKLELVENSLDDSPGNSFFFRVNNVPIFSAGSNWIPADMFIPRISREKYYDLVKLAAECNQVMLRVWGGGIYEEDALYDACDEMGIMIWQDFNFACGNYPADTRFRQSVEEEAISNVLRLRHHPCIVLWAGNNEDYQIMETENLDYDPGEENPKRWLSSSFPARYIYEKLLKDIMSKYAPQIPYRFGSPWGGESTRDPTTGDIHQWDVWHGIQAPYQDFDKLTGRFISEFGMQAFPSSQTVNEFIEDGSGERYAQSSTMDHHNKATLQARKLATYLVENLRYTMEPLEQYIYCTQLMQSECLSTALRVWKRQWKGPGKEYCGGALVWQLNDCWPGTSWSIIDSSLRPKLAYYGLKRELKPLTVAISRKPIQSTNEEATLDSCSSYLVEVWACNTSLQAREVDVLVYSWDITTGRMIDTNVMLKSVTLKSNQTTELTKFEALAEQRTIAGFSQTIFAAYLLENGQQLGRHVNWPEPLKHVHLQRPKAMAVKLVADKTAIQLTTDFPVKGAQIECSEKDVGFDDNGIDLVPGEILTVGVSGISSAMEPEFTIRHLGV